MVAEIKMGAYIHVVFICVGAYHPDFTVLLYNNNSSPIMAVHYYDATVPQQSVLTLNSNMIRTNLLNHVSALGTFAYDCCISLWSVHYCDLFTKTITMATWRYDRNSSSSGTV